MKKIDRNTARRLARWFATRHFRSPWNFCRFHAVYGLHAGDGVIRYVGCTTKKPHARMLAHISESRWCHRCPVHVWIHGVLASGGCIEVKTLSSCGSREFEQQEIRRRALAGEPLLNVEGNPFARRRGAAISQLRATRPPQSLEARS